MTSSVHEDSDVGPWSVAWQLATRTCAFARDISLFVVGGVLSDKIIAPISGGGGAILLMLEKEAKRVIAIAEASAVVPNLASNTTLFTMTEAGREQFVTAFPRYSSWLPPGPSSVFACAAWVLFVAFAVMWGVRVLWPKAGPEVIFMPNEGQHVERICTEIRRARRRVWLAMFMITEDVAEQVLSAHKRGLDVKIMVGRQHSIQASAGHALTLAGVPMVMDCSSSALTRHKFAVLDGTVLAGSFNWSCQAISANRENLCILRDVSLARTFAAEFQKLWLEFSADGKLGKMYDQDGGKPVEVQKVRRQRAATPPPKRS
uniref:Mitochondrial cardiolipin hydrolase n=1 Tax=Noctiluca scintillans TaxID=2966 RepID=A0A7S1A271_NOCSC|mmetsp:Transcript_27692/g.73056  ORF Transcript_27692/g.73056 Transcript_27692/m.73056 type:complete len:317 (+) Transcript_27692:116-1066(+)